MVDSIPPTGVNNSAIKPRAKTPEELAALEKKRLDALASVNPQASTYSTLANLNDDSFSLRLSKHLDDFRRGQGYLSANVAGELYTKSGRTASLLGAEDPTASGRYNAYSTAFGYESRARFIQGLSSTADTASTLRKLSKKLSEIA